LAVIGAKEDSYNNTNYDDCDCVVRSRVWNLLRTVTVTIGKVAILVSVIRKYD